MRFPIRFDPMFRVLCRGVLLAPDAAFVDVADDLVHVRFSWAFRATLRRSGIFRAGVHAGRPISRGVHGFGGRWLVNGAGDRVAELVLSPSQGAHVLGVPVELGVLLVSVDDPEALVRAVARRG